MEENNFVNRWSWPETLRFSRADGLRAGQVGRLRNTRFVASDNQTNRRLTNDEDRIMKEMNESIAIFVASLKTTAKGRG